MSENQIEEKKAGVGWASFLHHITMQVMET
jgi:hypothetical protein